jgi:hypothetical protein
LNAKYMREGDFFSNPVRSGDLNFLKKPTQDKTLIQVGCSAQSRK